LTSLGTRARPAASTVKLEFELSPQIKRIGRRACSGLEVRAEIMTRGNATLVQSLLALRSRLGRYHPERHYMRGPGPKTLSKLGEMYRAETQDDLQERLPEKWIALTRAIEERGGHR
jgi:hypothetical protein